MFELGVGGQLLLRGQFYPQPNIVFKNYVIYNILMVVNGKNWGKVPEID